MLKLLFQCVINVFKNTEIFYPFLLYLQNLAIVYIYSAQLVQTIFLLLSSHAWQMATLKGQL